MSGKYEEEITRSVDVNSNMVKSAEQNAEGVVYPALDSVSPAYKDDRMGIIVDPFSEPVSFAWFDAEDDTEPDVANHKVLSSGVKPTKQLPRTSFSNGQMIQPGYHATPYSDPLYPQRGNDHNNMFRVSQYLPHLSGNRRTSQGVVLCDAVEGIHTQMGGHQTRPRASNGTIPLSAPSRRPSAYHQARDSIMPLQYQPTYDYARSLPTYQPLESQDKLNKANGMNRFPNGTQNHPNMVFNHQVNFGKRERGWSVMALCCYWFTIFSIIFLVSLCISACVVLFQLSER